ncbi:MAG TPA: condensation domain-containing protein [Candidatus Cybelea sp.]|nr:condensation domain-containing protein [Candidatus Cybelea sp.]
MSSIETSLGHPRERRQQSLGKDSFVVPHWFYQQNLWIADPENSNSAVYNYPLLLRIHGPLNQKALEESLQELVRRHGILRSLFGPSGKELLETVLPPQPFSLPVTDLSDVAEAERENRARDCAQQAAKRSFDLRREPPFRASLLCFGPQDHALLLVTHHLVYDDWSNGILIRELSALYQAFTAGQPSPLPDLAFQYGDFVRWQNERLNEQEYDSCLSFWKSQLSADNDFYHLACDRIRPSVRTYQGALEKRTLPETLTESLKLWSQRERATLFISSLAGFQFLLHRYSGHGDIAIGSCAANRLCVEAEGLIGRFGNDIVIRTCLAGNPTYREALARVRESFLKAYSYQHLPFGAVVDKFAPPSHPNRNPLFQVMFIFQNAPKDGWRIPSLSLRWLPVEPGTAKYDLNVWLRQSESLEVGLEYNTDLFERATMQRILDDYRKVLEAMMENPDGRIDDLPICARLQSEPPPPADPPRIEITVPRDETEQQLTQIWEQLLGIQPIGPQQNFFELGGDSLLATRLFTQIEGAFRIRLQPSVLLEAQTIEELAKTLRHRGWSANCSSLVAVHPSGARPPLICIHEGWGQIFFCRQLSRFLGPDQPIYGLRQEGLETGHGFWTVEEMAERYLREIQCLQPHGPYYFAGNCFGGLIAFDMTHRLHREGEKVALLAMFNTPAPGSLRGFPFSQIFRVRERAQYYTGRLRSMSTDERLKYLRKKSRGILRYVIGQAETQVWRIAHRYARNRNSALAQDFLSLHDSNVESAKKYRPAPCPVHVDLFLTSEALSFYRVDPSVGWKPYALDGLDVYEVPGDIESATQYPYAEVLSEKLRQCMDLRIRPNTSPGSRE